MERVTKGSAGDWQEWPARTEIGAIEMHFWWRQELSICERVEAIGQNGLKRFDSCVGKVCVGRLYKLR